MLTDIFQQGAAAAWLYLPTAVLLGALHGLEPGHSKTMMAAFIIAVRGTVMQAVLLGLCATFSHTLIVWVVALGGMYLWRGVDAESFEPYLQVASAVLIIGIALWMLWRTRREQHVAQGHAHGHDHHDDHDHDHSQDHDHSHAHGPHSHAHEAARRIDTGHGVIAVEVFEDDVPPRWRIRSVRGDAWSANEVRVTTERPGGARQTFGFAARGEYLESIEEIPEPHEFLARVSLGHGGHTHDYDLEFVEHDHGHAHDHDHAHHHAHDHLHGDEHGHGLQAHSRGEPRGLALPTDEPLDSHALAHANDIRRRFANRQVTTGQIVMFGLTGGLVPCGAAVTVLLLCLQTGRFLLGVALVFCFSIGLALTLVAVGAAAAFGARHAAKRLPWFGALATTAPYLSSVLILVLGLYVGYEGIAALAARAA
jgi:nickel/cobalt exporter